MAHSSHRAAEAIFEDSDAYEEMCSRRDRARHADAAAGSTRDVKALFKMRKISASLCVKSDRFEGSRSIFSIGIEEISV